ncbi:DUF2934 domain-containing protein [Rubellimicrobium sp. CFH 75288]|uniref:DUF2934 domain-containing protein n=1 Tax=Rubellimicrobium sp. CFH 75288 TaxID=2697034 RepID=UPI001412B28F|nr:DUF2934 domain-containing protein [Rubellimicrobium sp. CFH 75288]NAZ37207.1 DUF2934 domain-containing protein [Rubellimicrobium sp. CFH 75288]
MNDREERIRARAHAIWEREGCPDGRHEEHWRQATAEIDAEEGQGGAQAEAMIPAEGADRTEPMGGAAPSPLPRG